MRAVEQCDSFAPREPAKFAHRWIARQFLLVAAAEFAKSFWLVAEPNSQFWTWRDLLHPKRESRALLADAPRPKPIHQDPSPVPRRRGLVNSLNCDCHVKPLQVPSNMRLGYRQPVTRLD